MQYVQRQISYGKNVEHYKRNELWMWRVSADNSK